MMIVLILIIVNVWTVTELYEELNSCVNSEESDVRTAAVTSLCKLLFCGRYDSVTALSNLIIQLFNPTTEYDFV